MSDWKYTDATQRVASRQGPDGYESVLASALPDGTEVLPASDAPALSSYEADVIRYKARAAAKDQLLAEMAAENMARIRSGAWTVPDLESLMADPDLSAALGYMATLSFELAHGAVTACTHPLMTEEIRAGWLGKLAAHFYNEAP
jgi:hypothetical protein